MLSGESGRGLMYSVSVISQLRRPSKFLTAERVRASNLLVLGMVAEVLA